MNANDHPYRVTAVDSAAITANDHPFKVLIEGGVVTPEEFEELEKKVDALATDLSYKGGVPTYEDLPTNPETGDVYTTEDTGILYVWDGAQWVPLNKSQAAITGTDAPTAATEGELGQAYLDTTHQKIYYLAQITENPTTYVWKSYGPEVVQATGTSTTNVMSQNATTSMVFADPSTKYKIRLGFNSGASGFAGAAIGYASRANAQGSVALGACSSTTHPGEVNIGSTETPYGYNNSNYRLLSGLYEGQSEHDAAIVGQITPITDTEFNNLINGES